MAFNIDTFQEGLMQLQTGLESFEQQYQGLEAPAVDVDAVPELDASEIDKVENLQLPTTFYDPAPTMASIAETNRSLAEQYTTRLNSANSNEDVILGQIDNTLATLEGRDKTQLQLEEEEEIRASEKELQDLLGVINKRTAFDRRADILDMKELEDLSGQGKGVAAEIVRRQQGRLSKDQGFEKLLRSADTQNLIATAELKQGNIQQAREAINDKLDLLYGPEEKKLERLEFALERNDAKVNRLSGTQQTAMREYISDQKSLIADKKEEERLKLSLVEKAAASGASTELMNQIIGADTLEDATVLANGAVADEVNRAEALRSSGGGGSSSSSSDEKPFSVWEIGQIEQRYGVTPPPWMNRTQFNEILMQNPTATPEELQQLVSNYTPTGTIPEGAFEIGAEDEVEQGKYDIQRIDGKLYAIPKANNNMFLSTSYLKENFDKAEIFAASKKAEQARWWTPRGMDRSRFLNFVNEKVNEARVAGISDEETLAWLKSNYFTTNESE